MLDAAVVATGSVVVFAGKVVSVVDVGTGLATVGRSVVGEVGSVFGVGLITARERREMFSDALKARAADSVADSGEKSTFRRFTRLRPIMSTNAVMIGWAFIAETAAFSRSWRSAVGEY